jgi:hypothetical protein
MVRVEVSRDKRGADSGVVVAAVEAASESCRGAPEGGKSSGRGAALPRLSLRGRGSLGCTANTGGGTPLVSSSGT